MQSACRANRLKTNKVHSCGCSRRGYECPEALNPNTRPTLRKRRKFDLRVSAWEQFGFTYPPKFSCQQQPHEINDLALARAMH